MLTSTSYQRALTNVFPIVVEQVRINSQLLCSLGDDLPSKIHRFLILVRQQVQQHFFLEYVQAHGCDEWLLLRFFLRKTWRIGLNSLVRISGPKRTHTTCGRASRKVFGVQIIAVKCRSKLIGTRHWCTLGYPTAERTKKP